MGTLGEILDSVERTIDTKRNRITRILEDNDFSPEKGEHGEEIYVRGSDLVIFGEKVTYISGGIPLIMEYKYAADEFFPKTYKSSNIVEHYSNRAIKWARRNLIGENSQEI